MRERIRFEREMLELEVGKELWATNGEYRESDNYVQWLADGASAMYEMCDAFCKATEFIYLISAYFSPGMLLVRGNEYNKIYNKHKDTIDKVKALNQTKGIPVDSISLVSLLAVRANDLPVRIIMFHPVTAPFGPFTELDQESLGMW